MRVVLCGVEYESKLGDAVGRRLSLQGHSVVIWARAAGIPSRRREGDSHRITGDIADDGVRREILAADVLIDLWRPVLFNSLRNVEVPRPLLLRRALKDSGKSLIVTSSVHVLGDTGPIPVGETRRLPPPMSYRSLAKLELEILGAADVRGVVVRPGMVHGARPTQFLGGWLGLSAHCGRGAYITPGTNRWSAVHVDDLADLYCRLLKNARPGLVVHAAGESITMRDVAEVVQRESGRAGEPVGISLAEALKFCPVAKALCQSHAISSEMAKKELGWEPSGASILREVEVWARRWASAPGRARATEGDSFRTGAREPKRRRKAT